MMKNILPVTVFLLSALLSCPTWADVPAQNTSATPVKIISDITNKKNALCNDVEEILLIKHNLNYLSSTKTVELEKIDIPKKFKEFDKIKWSASSISEFNEKLPTQHNNILRYLNREDLKSTKIESVYKTSIDVYNHGVSNEIFSVTYNGIQRKYMSEPNPVRRGFKKIFDDNASAADPFAYKNAIYFIEKRGNTLLIEQYKSVENGKVPVSILCKYDLD